MISVTGAQSMLNVIFKSGDLESESYTREARVSRVKTLDGNVLMTHEGFNAGDSDLLVKVTNASAAEESTLKTIFETDTLVGISCRDGYYHGAISQIRARSGQIDFKFTIKDV